MKKIILLIASVLFSILFYQNHFGINLFIFSLIITGIIAFSYPTKIKEKQIISKTVIYMLTAFLVFVNHNTLSIIANLVSFFLFVGSVSEKKASIYIQFINGLYTTIIAAFSKYMDRMANEIKQVKKKEINYIFWLKIIGIPIIVLGIFITLYRNTNPVFDTLISKIDFSFINLQWLVFTGLGYYLIYNISNPIIINPVTDNDLQTKNQLEKDTLKQVPIETLQSENQLGLVLMILLNILILFLLATDIYYLSENMHRLENINLSVQVHKGINALIASIILAIIIIIYFFRGNLNFYKKSKALKKATYLWIFLNIVLVFVTLFKNYQYVYLFGFTYKRIGVFVYLFLAITGLVFTYIKVKNIKNIVFLFRKNIEIAFAVLVVASFINWDVFITKYNLNAVKHPNLDVEYLLKLKNNASTLKQFANKVTIHSVTNFSEQIDIKYANYQIDIMENSWQEFNFETFNTKQ